MGIEPMSAFTKLYTTTCVSLVFYVSSEDKSNLKPETIASILFELLAIHLIQKTCMDNTEQNTEQVSREMFSRLN